MKFIRTTKVAPVVHKNVYKLKTIFDDGENFVSYITDTKLIEVLINTYDKYAKNLKEDWNHYCNPDYEDVIGYFKEISEKLNFDSEEIIYDIEEYWARSNEYDCYARFTSYNLTFFDENGIEHNIKIEN